MHAAILTTPLVLRGLCVTVGACLLIAAPGWAAEAETPDEAATPPVETPEPPTETRWEGAIGLNASYGPAYQGSDETRARLGPGYFLRHGRFTITNTGGYVTRRADEVFRGLGVDLTDDDDLRVNLALRFDAGRSESTATALNGLGDIKPTVRARLSGSWRLDDGWRLGASWNADIFARGGGNFGDIGFARDQRPSPDIVWTWGANLSAAGDRYMQTYFGIDEEHAAATGYPLYTPGAGLRDVSAFANLRIDLSQDWLGLASISTSRMLGPAADSPLTKQASGWSIRASLAWRF